MTASIERTVQNCPCGKPHSSTQATEYRTTSAGHVTIHQNLKQSMKMETLRILTDLNRQNKDKKEATFLMTLTITSMMDGIQKAPQLSLAECQARTLIKYEPCTNFSKIATSTLTHSEKLNSPMFSHKSSKTA